MENTGTRLSDEARLAEDVEWGTGWMSTDPDYWNMLASSSLKDAKALLDADRRVACCLHCHAAIEKSLKALLAAQGRLQDGDDTHTLTKLANRAGVKQDLGSEMWSCLVVMSGLHQKTSYPSSSHVWRCLNDPGYVTMIWSNTLRIYRWLYVRQAALYEEEGGPHGD